MEPYFCWKPAKVILGNSVPLSYVTIDIHRFLSSFDRSGDEMTPFSLESMLFPKGPSLFHPPGNFQTLRGALWLLALVHLGQISTCNKIDSGKWHWVDWMTMSISRCGEKHTLSGGSSLTSRSIWSNPQAVVILPSPEGTKRVGKAVGYREEKSTHIHMIAYSRPTCRSAMRYVNDGTLPRHF